MIRLCTICARGGSKGVPKKNLRRLLGKPLLVWSIQQAKQSGLFDKVVVSSDSEEILAAAREGGADLALRRPDDLAGDTTPKVPAILHALEEGSRRLGINPSILVDLDATSPLRLPTDIVGAVELLQSSGATSVITGSRLRK